MAQDPDDNELRARLRRRVVWMDAQARWGRDTMGFGIYLFRRSDEGV